MLGDSFCWEFIFSQSNIYFKTSPFALFNFCCTNGYQLLLLSEKIKILDICFDILKITF